TPRPGSRSRQASRGEDRTWSGILRVAITDPFPELQPFVAEPQRSALLFDVDGTLAPIVLDPADSAVPEAVRRMLDQVAHSYGLVACISGRRALEARRIVGLDSITYVGNHGLDALAPGAREALVE